MLRLSVVFLVVALLAALFGFGIIEGYSLLAAKLFFFVFLVLAVLSAIGGGLRGRPTAI